METCSVKTIQATAVAKYVAGQHVAKVLASQGISTLSIKQCVFGWVQKQGVICKVRNNRADSWNVAIVTQYDSYLNRFVCSRGIVKHAVPLSITETILIS